MISIIFIIITPSINYLILTENPDRNRQFLADPDYMDNGNIMFCGGDILDAFSIMERTEDNVQYLPKEERNNYIMEINREGEIIWKVGGLDFPHEVLQLENGEILVADTLNDRVVLINYPNHFHSWEWRPDSINWTELNPEWGSDHYYNNNDGRFDWSHINDIDIKDYGNWKGLLISLRNFDLIIELNYTAAKSHSPRAEDIIWWFGDYKNHTLLNHQHNPDYLSSDNIIVADSENNRIIEIEKSTKKIIWKYENNLQWCRDVNELPQDMEGDYLISDTERIFAIDKESKEIVWEFTEDILQTYTTEINPETQRILVDCSFLGKIMEIDYKSKKITWEYGDSILREIIFFNSSILIGFLAFRIYVTDLKIKKSGEIFENKLKKKRITTMFLFGGIILLILLMIFHLELLRKILFNMVSSHDVG